MWITFQKIRNNFFIAVGLGNCMGEGQLFNKIISDFGSVPEAFRFTDSVATVAEMMILYPPVASAVEKRYTEQENVPHQPTLVASIQKAHTLIPVTKI